MSRRFAYLGARRDVRDGSPSRITPATIFGSTLKLWLRADLGVTIATGVSSWKDQSGNGNDVTQITGSKQPSLVTGVINGHPIARFAAASTQILSCASFSGIGAGTNPCIFTVAALTDGAANMCPVEIANTTKSSVVNMERAAGTLYARAVYATVGQKLASNLMGSTAFHRFDVRGEPTQVVLSIDSTEYTTATGGSYGMNKAVTQASVGAFVDGVEPLTGDIAEVVVTSSIPTAAQLAAFNAYRLAWFGV